MDKSLLIGVFVPTTDEANKDFKGKRGELATGYPVGKNLILTARHVLHPTPPQRRDKNYPVKIRWHYFCSSEESGWIEIPDEDIVWQSQGKLDAALIRCRRPPDAAGWGFVSSERPSDGMKWASEGFPRATKYENWRNPSSFIGKVCSKAPEEPYFELTVETPPEHEDGWKGASGMPVFVGHKILGVVQSVPTNFHAEKLHATPAWQLLEDKAFRTAIGYDEQAARVKKVKAKFVGMLKGVPDAIGVLAEQFEMDDEIVGLDNTEQAGQVAERLLETDVRDVVKALRRAHRSLCEESDDEIAKQCAQAAAILVEVAQLIVPVVYDYSVVRWTGGQQGSGSAALVPLPAGTETVAEIIMAGVDGRATLFRPREDEHDQPAGKLRLPLWPECGIDPGGAKAKEAAQGHLSRKFGGFRRAVDEYLLTHFSRTRRGTPKRSLEQRIKLTSDLLEEERDYSGQTYYMLFYPPEEVAEQNAMQDLVRSLKKYYPALMFLSLDPSFEQQRQDERLVDHLCRMLPMKEDGSDDIAAHSIESPNPLRENHVYKRQDLEKEWSLLNDKLSVLKKERILETRVEEKLRLKHLIDEAQIDLNRIEQQLEDFRPD